MTKLGKLRHFLIAAIIGLGMLGFAGAMPQSADAASNQAAQKTVKKTVAKKAVKKITVKKTAKKPAKKIVKKAVKKTVAKKAIAKKKGIGNGQCVAYARAISGIKHFGNAITWKRIVNSKAPVKGSVVVLNYGKYGHVAVVAAVNGDKITVSEQNYYGPHIINTRTISKSDPRILGYVAKLA